jgi:superfamily II DNA or RNA helicase
MIENNFTVSLRDYQKSAVSDVCNAIDNKVNSIVQLPTGTGKTTVIAEVIKNWRVSTGKNKRALIIAHRIELIDQIIDRLKTFGILAGKIKAGEPINANFQVQVGLIQSLRNDKRKPVSLGLIVVDEAHHITASSYMSLIDYYKNYSPVVVGFTATPSRLDGAALGSIFKKLFEYGQINKFIDSGYLSPLKHYATSSPNLKSIKIKPTGDYDEKALQQEMSRDLIMANLIEGYETHAMGKKMIVFAVNTYHSKLIAERYNERGYNAIALDYTTDSITRKNIINDFKSGTINILCNVNLFTEGFDCPDVEVVQLARPTKSLNLYLQMVGRGMRIYPGKEHGIILDNAKLWEEHGLTTRERLWTLNGLEKDERKIEIKNTRDFEKREKDANIPQESEKLALIEVISNLGKQKELNGLPYSIYSLPITLFDLLEFLKVWGHISNNGRISKEVLKTKYDHYLVNHHLSIFDMFKLFGIDILESQKTYSASKLTTLIFEKMKENKEDTMKHAIRHLFYFNICNWKQTGLYVNKSPLISKHYYSENQLNKLIETFMKYNLFDEFNLPNSFNKIINDNFKLSFEIIETIFLRIEQDHFDNTNKYILKTL